MPVHSSRNVVNGRRNHRHDAISRLTASTTIPEIAAPPQTDTPNFASSEVNGSAEHPPSDVAALDEAIAECHNSNSRQGVFAAKDLLSAVLAAAYRLALVLHSGGKAACEQALEHQYFKGRPRKPSNDKPFLIAVQLGAKPQDLPEHKACSMYATVLRCAQEHSVAGPDFESWLKSTTMQKCLDVMRGKSDKLGQQSKVKTSAQLRFGGWLPISLPPTLAAAFQKEIEKLEPDASEGQILDAVERAITASRLLLADTEVIHAP